MTVCAGTVIDGSDTSCATIGDTGGDSDIAGYDIAGERFNDKSSTATSESDVASVPVEKMLMLMMTMLIMIATKRALM